MEKAESKTTVTMFRWKPDWEAAQPLFEKAALAYKKAGAMTKSKAAYEKASLAQERLNSPWHAAKLLETAGTLAKECAEDEVTEFFRRACSLYAEAGRAQSGADALCRGAKAVEAKDPNSAAELLKQACEIYESEEKQHYAHDAHRSLIGLYVKSERYGEAAEALQRFATCCSKSGATNNQNKAYLGVVVVWLYAQNAKEADACYNDSLGVDSFMNSEEAAAASDLLSAYRGGDVEQVRSCLKRTFTFQNLDNMIARLAAKLPVGDVAAMAGQMAGGNEQAQSASWEKRAEEVELDENDLC